MFVEITENGIKKIVNLNYCHRIEKAENGTKLYFLESTIDSDDEYEKFKTWIDRYQVRK